jgi:hypothetical protein
VSALIGTAPWWLIVTAWAISEARRKVRGRHRYPRPAAGREAIAFADWLLEQSGRTSTGESA